MLNTNFTLPPPFTGTVNPHIASSYVGLHPQLLAYDAREEQWPKHWLESGRSAEHPLIRPSVSIKTITYQWYAGKIDRAANGTSDYTPVEFGALNLFPSDIMFQNPNGLFGSDDHRTSGLDVDVW